MLDKLPVGIEVVKDHIRIELVGSRKHNHLEVLVGLLEALSHIGSNVDSSLNHFFVWK